ncbi:hypothetical protein BOX15_Mlig005951g2 [Macrostomum lignano]|uniref:DUF4817 domain-containing protein n=1 Tax=Macrostomum lignano TaxID=282301 RepID=A0A267F4F2_9PLAT|nr:hypothetical protein BOX15_Mlig005951g2 [Macrostomum lignano]
MCNCRNNQRHFQLKAKVRMKINSLPVAELCFIEMASKFTEEDRVRILQFYYANGSSVTSAARRFNFWRNQQENAVEIPLCSASNVSKLIKKFTDKKTVKQAHKGNSGRPRSARTEERILEVLQELDESRTSLRQVAASTGLSYTSTQRIAKLDLHMYPYRTEVKHGLTEPDFVQRTELCTNMLQTSENGALFILFVDEAAFRTDGTVNLWNDRSWAVRSSQPDIPPAGLHQNAQRTHVLAAMSQHWLGGPYFFPGKVSAAAYQRARAFSSARSRGNAH